MLVGTAWGAVSCTFLGRCLFGLASHASATCENRWHLWHQTWIRLHQLSTFIFSRARKDGCETCFKRRTRVGERTIAIQESLGTSWSYLSGLCMMVFLFLRKFSCMWGLSPSLCNFAFDYCVFSSSLTLITSYLLLSYFPNLPSRNIDQVYFRTLFEGMKWRRMRLNRIIYFKFLEL